MSFLSDNMYRRGFGQYNNSWAWVGSRLWAGEGGWAVRASNCWCTLLLSSVVCHGRRIHRTHDDFLLRLACLLASQFTILCQSSRSRRHLHTVGRTSRVGGGWCQATVQRVRRMQDKAASCNTTTGEGQARPERGKNAPIMPPQR
jgi:hypothetical protein